MFTICMQSFYFVYFFHILVSNILFFIGIKYSEGDLKSIVIVRVAFDFIIFLTLPLLMFMGSNMCVIPK